jgi:hypothetical protein
VFIRGNGMLLTSELLTCLMDLPDTSSLYISDAAINGNDVDTLLSLAVRRLSFHHCRLETRTTKRGSLPTNPALHSLNLGIRGLTPSQAGRIISACENIEELSISDITFGTVLHGAIRDLHNLRDLDLTECNRIISSPREISAEVLLVAVSFSHKSRVNSIQKMFPCSSVSALG